MVAFFAPKSKSCWEVTLSRLAMSWAASESGLEHDRPASTAKRARPLHLIICPTDVLEEEQKVEKANLAGNRRGYDVACRGRMQ